jgi:antitoxin component YwqK of YwqJK toxin-antitoxin module
MSNNNTYTRRTELHNRDSLVSTYSSITNELVSEEIYHNNILSQSEEYINKNDIIYKIQKKFLENGTLSEFSEFIGDIRVGLHKKYYNNGNLQFVKSYNNQGQLHGVSTVYHPDGTAITYTNYINNTALFQ